MSNMVANKLSPITITEAAVKEIVNILEVKGIPADYLLRVGTQGGGCSGVSYIIGFDQRNNNDELYFINGIQVLIDKRQALFLWGVQVDFIENSLERGFSLTQVS